MYKRQTLKRKLPGVCAQELTGRLLAYVMHAMHQGSVLYSGVFLGGRPVLKLRTSEEIKVLYQVSTVTMRTGKDLIDTYSAFPGSWASISTLIAAENVFENPETVQEPEDYLKMVSQPPRPPSILMALQPVTGLPLALQHKPTDDANLGFGAPAHPVFAGP